jgi:hypothetical protein
MSSVTWISSDVLARAGGTLITTTGRAVPPRTASGVVLVDAVRRRKLVPYRTPARAIGGGRSADLPSCGPGDGRSLTVGSDPERP